MKKLIGIAVVAAVALGASSYFSPYLTLHQMKSAIDKRDAEAFSEHVDFPALRENIKGQMMVMVNEQMAKSAEEDKNNPLAGAGKAMAAAFIGPLVDAAVTPAAVIGMLKNGDTKPDVKGGGDAGKNGDKTPDFSVSREGWSKVVVRKVGENKDEGGFVFKRDGLWSWKLVAVEMPKPILGAAK